MVKFPSAGIAWRKMDAQTSSVIQQNSLQVVTVIHLLSHEKSYLNVMSFLCANNKIPAKSTMITATIRMHSQGILSAVREWRLKVC